MAFSVRASVSTVAGKSVQVPKVLRASVVVRAEAAEAAAVKEAPAAWVAPTLDPNTPSPIFGGSTGGLLRKAQV